MKRNFDMDILFPGLYRHDLLNWQLNEMQMSMLQVSALAKVNYRTVRAVFDGRANNNKVWRVANVLKLDWAQLHNLKLKESEFHLAVTNGGSKSAR